MRGKQCNWVDRGAFQECTTCKLRSGRKGTRICLLDRSRKHTLSAKPIIYLGDRVEIWLSRIGITPARIIACKKACGLKPKCGCGKRKRWLNQLDKRVRRLFG